MMKFILNLIEFDMYEQTPLPAFASCLCVSAPFPRPFSSVTQQNKMASVEDEAGAGTSKLSIEERLETGMALKEKGNEYFKKQEYRNAMKSYHKALLYVKGIIDRPNLPGLEASEEDISDEAKNNIHKVQFSCYNNLAGKISIL